VLREQVMRAVGRDDPGNLAETGMPAILKPRCMCQRLGAICLSIRIL